MSESPPNPARRAAAPSARSVYDRHRMNKHRSQISICLALAALGYVALQNSAHAADDKDWQAVARAEIDFVHDTLQRAHPGAIDPQNPAFNQQLQGFRAHALELVPRVIDYQSMMAAVRYYANAFNDGHLSYSDGGAYHNAEEYPPMYVAGWSVDLVGDDYIVSRVVPHFSGDLPPLGARLLSCDGQLPDRLYRERVAPFVVGLSAANRALQIPLLTHRRLKGDELQQCRFQTADGRTLDLKISFEPISFSEARALFVGSPERSTPVNYYELDAGILWIHAATFTLPPEQVKPLDSMLEALRRLKGVRAIVFDSRGNHGGDSSVGGRIFNAATGGLEFDHRGEQRLPRVYAQWRVSDVAIDTLNDRIERATQLYGSGSANINSLTAIRNGLLRMRASGRSWYEQWDPQDGGFRLDRNEMIKRHGHLRRFSGPVVLVTDEQCVSACLDFADLVRNVPGSVHAGHTTGSDSVYIDIGIATAPTGNHLILPLKVWRNRLRGNNEAWIPDVPFDCDMHDDALVRQKTLEVIQRAWAKG